MAEETCGQRPLAFDVQPRRRRLEENHVLLASCNWIHFLLLLGNNVQQLGGPRDLCRISRIDWVRFRFPYNASRR